MPDMDEHECSSDSLLEEALRNAEQELFPKLRQNLSEFIDTFNHERVQRCVSSDLNQIFDHFDKIQSSTSVFEIVRSMRNFLDFIRRDSLPIKFLQGIQSSSYFALVNDERYNFLDNENETTEERVDKFLHFVDAESVQSNVCQAFEDYIKSWSEERRRWECSERYIQAEVNNMRKNLKEAELYADSIVNKMIDDVRNYFEPLREELVAKRNVAYGVGGGAAGAAIVTGMLGIIFPPLLVVSGGILVTGGVAAGVAGNKLRRTIPGWYDDVSRQIILFLQNKLSEEELSGMIELEGLEGDFTAFKRCTINWLNHVNKRPARRNSLLISKDVAMAEIDRMSKFMYALILNKEELIEEHRQAVDNLLEAASNSSSETSDKILPILSFGQQEIPEKGIQARVRLSFVLRSETSHAGAKSILQELKLIFSGLKASNIEHKNNAYILHIEVESDGLSTLIALSMSRLSDLSICAILVGSFGITGPLFPGSESGVHGIMYPRFNRIYGRERANGFTTTDFPNPIMHGGEPYYCPRGWRRYSLYTGKDARGFHIAYGDWPVAYHGTKGHLLSLILKTGFIDGPGAAHGKGIYLSPSIKYCGHPRYAEVWKAKGKFVQMVLQVRVKKELIFKKCGTLHGARSNDPVLDPHFQNNELEWVVKPPPGVAIDAARGIVVYGIMLRVTDSHLKQLPECSWWGSYYS